MQGTLVSRGPLSVLMDATWLQFYHSGVWDPWECSDTDLDHGVCVCVCEREREGDRGRERGG